LVHCSHCGKKILRRKGWVKENIKLKQRNYCSLKCLAEGRRLRVTIRCENPLCGKNIERVLTQLSPHNYCSHSCAMIVNNKKFPKRIALVKQCKYCRKNFKGGAIKYCSTKCQYLAAKISKDKLLKLIRTFYKKNGRIPFKSEFSHYHAIRGRFGTWNHAIKSAGFEPNPVMFAKKFIANDGHKCDSLSEKIIDDWLYARGVKHEINFPYPGNGGFSTDFKVGNFWIEFFGLSGQHKKYDELKFKKMNLAKINKLKIVEIYPKDLYPKSKLRNILGMLTGR